MNDLKVKRNIKKKKIGKSPIKGLKSLLLSGPTMSAAQYQSFLKTRVSFDQWKGK